MKLWFQLVAFARLPLCILALLTPVVGAAQDPAREILVTANRLPQPANVVMAATTVINREAIRQSLAQSLFELLSGLPGMQLAPAGGQGAQTSLFLRGTESDHTLILMDGAQIMTSTGAAGRLEFIPLDQIERIEIVRGPRSSVYGSEAIGGVVNIITRRTADEDLGGLISLQAGSEHSSNANLSLQGRTGATSMSLDGSSRKTDGINFTSTGNPDKDGYESDSLALSLQQDLADRATAAVSYSRFDTAADYDDGTIDGRSAQWLGEVAANLTGRWHSLVRLASFKEENEDIGSFGATASQSQNRILGWHNTFIVGMGQNLAFGIERQKQELRYVTFAAVQNDTRRDSEGIYGIYLYEGAPLDVSLSLRHDDNEHFGGHSTGSLALGRDFADSLRGWVSVGTAFKAPNLIDLYVDFPAFFFYANPALEPETAKNIELGLRWQGLGASWQFNLFRNEIKDLIGSDATFSTLANVQKALIEGLETSVAGSLGDWHWGAALTLLTHENLTTGAKLLRRPEQTFSFNLSRQLGQIDLGLNLLTQSDHRDIDPVSFGASEVGGYSVVNLVAGYQLREDLSWRLRVGNLLDRNYQIVDGFNTPGRTLQLSLDYRF